MSNGFAINHKPVSAAGLPLSSADSAHQTLTKFRAHLQSGQGIKQGVLFLRSDKDGQVHIKRDRAFHLSLRRGDAFTQAAASMKTLFLDAYQGRVSPQVFDALSRGLDAYLDNRGQKLGTHTFAKLVDQFERAATQREAALRAGAEALSPEAASLLAGNAAASALKGLTVTSPVRAAPQEASMEVGEGMSFVKTSEKDRVANLRQGVALAFGHEVREVVSLGAGSSANAFKLGQGQGAAAVTVQRSKAEPQLLSLASLNSGEMAAASVRSPMPHVAKPTDFLLSVSRPMNEQLSHQGGAAKAISLEGQARDTYAVPQDKLRRFLQAQPPGSEVQLVAVKMPAGASTTVSQAARDKPLSKDEFFQLSAGLYLGMAEMQQAKLLHHDIKPANVTFDRATGQVTVVDLGSAVQIGEDGTTTEWSSGSPLYSPPTLVKAPGTDKAVRHGQEVDRFAFGMTLIASLAPDLEAAQPFAEFSQAFATLGDADHVGAYLQALDQAALRPQADEATRQKAVDAKAQLLASFERIPGARAMLESVLVSVHQPASAQVTWGALALALNQAPGLPAKDREALNKLSAQHLQPLPGGGAAQSLADPQVGMPGDPGKAPAFSLSGVAEADYDK